MASTKYTYGIASFSGLNPGRTRPNLAALVLQVQSSAVTIALDLDLGPNWSTTDEECDVWFKSVLDASDQTELGAVVVAHDGEPLPDPTNDSGVPIVTFPRSQDDKSPTIGIGPRLSGSELIRASHDFTDKTTWWSDSVRSTDEALVDQGDGLTWKSATPNRIWINIYGGKFLREDKLDSTHGIVVKVDDVEQVMRNWFEDTWDPVTPEDYYIDPENGAVVFRVSQAGNTVTATYSYENGSSWYLQPAEGKLLYLEEAELNASADVEFNDTIRYDTEVYIPGAGWIAVASTLYKGLWQIIQECRGNHVVVPAIGGVKRGIQNDAIQIPLIYVADKTLKSSDSVRLRVYLENDTVFGGEHGSITFYALSRREDST